MHLLHDDAGPASARIAAGTGNNVLQLTVRPPGRNEPVDVILPPASPDGVGAGGWGGDPDSVPFPQPGAGRRFSFEGQAYQLDVNETALGNHIHGLVARAPWKVEGTGASDELGSLAAGLDRPASRPRDLPPVPLPLRLTVTTRLHEGVLIQAVEARNTGPGRLPMGFGTHSWFPAVLGGGSREATLVRVPGNRYWRLENLVPTGETVAVQSDPGKFDLREWSALDGNAYDDVFTDLVRRPDGWSEAGIRYPAAGLELRVEASPEFREWVIYAPTTPGGVPGTVHRDDGRRVGPGVDAGLVVLDPGASWSGRFGPPAK